MLNLVEFLYFSSLKLVLWPCHRVLNGPSVIGVGVGGATVLPDHLGKVHHVGDGALTREWTLGLVAAVAGWRGGLAVGLQDLFVVSGDLILHTWETAVTDFQGVSVEDLAQGMFLMKR